MHTPAFNPAGAIREAAFGAHDTHLRARHFARWVAAAFEAAGIEPPAPSTHGAAFVAEFTRLARDPRDVLDEARTALAAATTEADERKAARAAAAELATAAGLARIEPFGAPAATVFTQYAQEVRLAADLAGLDAIIEALRPAFAKAVDDLKAAAAKLRSDEPLDAAAALARDDVETIGAQVAARDALRRLAALTPRRADTSDEFAAPCWQTASAVLTFTPEPGAVGRVELTNGTTRRSAEPRHLNPVRNKWHTVDVDTALVRIARGDVSGFEFVLRPPA